MERDQAEPIGRCLHPLRILHVSDVYLPRMGGIELHVRDLVERQQAAGHEVEIATLTRDPDGAASRVAVHRPDRRAAVASWTFPRGLLGYARYDVVHAHISAVSPLAVLTARHAASMRPPVPTVVTVHSLWRRYTGAYHAADLLTRWSRWPIAWSAVSHAAAASVRRAASGPLDVAVIPNGIDPASWVLSRSPARGGQLRIASVLRFAARKRPLPLLRMLRTVRDRLPPSVELSAVLIGDGPARPAMQRYVERHRMNWVEMPGPLSRAGVAAQLAGADLYLAPAVLESFGIAALEAHLIGLPVIARRDTGIADFIVDGRDGRLCASDEEMVDAVIQLLDRPLRRRAQPTEIVDNACWEAVVRRTDELYAHATSLVATERAPAVRATAEPPMRTPMAS